MENKNKKKKAEVGECGKLKFDDEIERHWVIRHLSLHFDDFSDFSLILIPNLSLQKISARENMSFVLQFRPSHSEAFRILETIYDIYNSWQFNS